MGCELSPKDGSAGLDRLNNTGEGQIVQLACLNDSFEENDS